MQQVEQLRGSGGADRKRVEAVVETLAALRSESETVAEVAHDARNMVTALGLYCDLLEEPGVLAPPFLHYGSELRLVAAATVFLDEIGELSLDLQAKLLRALQEKEVRPVGATHRVPIKARIVAATNRDLAEMVEKGTFRKDLFYRLNVVNLRLPSLRDRREDIPLLAAHFLDRISREHGVKFTLSDEALRAMMRHDWPGNVRELENSVERACALSSGPVLRLGDLPTQLQQQGLESRRTADQLGEPVAEGGTPEVQTLADLERRAILGAIRTLNGDKLQAAKLLGIGKTTLYRKLKEYGIADPLSDE
jgi:two-component system response regulator HydG